MSYDIIAVPKFKKELKKLARKYASLKSEFGRLIEQLEKEPHLGTSLGHNCYKIRIAIASKGKGKSGGARIITHVFVENTVVYLLSIYDKSEKDSLTEKELLELLLSID